MLAGHYARLETTYSLSLRESSAIFPDNNSFMTILIYRDIPAW